MAQVGGRPRDGGRPSGQVCRGARDRRARSIAAPSRRAGARAAAAGAADRPERAARRRRRTRFPSDFVPLPDRWRLVEALGVNERWYDPYNQNTLKGDLPVFKD